MYVKLLLKQRFTSHEITNLSRDFSSDFPPLTLVYSPSFSSFLNFSNEDFFENEIFWCQVFFSWIFISKIGVKINLRITIKNPAADTEIEFLTKSISKPYGNATTMPTAWELSTTISGTPRISEKCQIFWYRFFFLRIWSCSCLRIKMSIGSSWIRVASFRGQLFLMSPYFGENLLST